jgi:hypothetical protein
MFPIVFLNNKGASINHHFSPPVGGIIGPLAYSYYFNAHFFIGGEIGFYFNYTLGQNVVYFIPIGLRTGWQFTISRFEIPLNVTIGVVPQRYLTFGYAGLFIKSGVSVFFRFNANWSFGLANEWGWYPEWPKDNGKRVPHKDINAFFTSVTLAARYHF